MSSIRPPSLPWLTVLRYPAAVWVILCHCLSKSIEVSDSSLVLPTAFRMFADRGFLGVSFFFILSGFILAWNYPTIAAPRDYLRARVARVLPVYYLALLFALPLLLARIVEEGFRPILIPKLLMVATLTQSWLPSVSSLWNGPAWTLSCEAFFYTSLILMLPHVSKLFGNCRSSRLALSLGLLWIIGLIAPLIYIQYFGVHMDAVPTSGVSVPKSQAIAKIWIERFPLLRVIEFTAGVLVCVRLRHIVSGLKPVHALALIMGGGFWIATSFLLPFILSMGTWCLPGFACIILGFAALPYPPKNSLFGFAQLLGNGSYAVYLFHIPIRDYLVFVYQRIFDLSALSGRELYWGMSLMVTFVTTALGLLIFTYYEEPMRIWLKTRWTGRSRTVGFDAVPTVSDATTFRN